MWPLSLSLSLPFFLRSRPLLLFSFSVTELFPCLAPLYRSLSGSTLKPRGQNYNTGRAAHRRGHPNRKSHHSSLLTFKFASIPDVAFVFLFIFPPFLLLIYYAHPYFSFAPHPNYLPALIIALRLVLFYRVILLRLYSRFLPPLFPHKCAQKQRATPFFFLPSSAHVRILRFI